MKSFFDLAKNRRSTHSFTQGFTISDTEFLQLLETVRYTPSGYNAQPWQFLLVREPENLQRLHSLAYKQDHILKAGNAVIVLGDVRFGENEHERIVEEWKKFRGFSNTQCDALSASLTKTRPEWKQREMMLRNCSLAAMSFLFAAEDAGFAACPMMGFRQLDLRRHFEIPENLLPVLLIALGKSAENEAPQLPRKNPLDFAWQERVGQKFSL